MIPDCIISKFLCAISKYIYVFAKFCISLKLNDNAIKIINKMVSFYIRTWYKEVSTGTKVGCLKELNASTLYGYKYSLIGCCS